MEIELQFKPSAVLRSVQKERASQHRFRHEEAEAFDALEDFVSGFAPDDLISREDIFREALSAADEYKDDIGVRFIKERLHCILSRCRPVL